jgi:hypothetical protein
LDPFFERGVRVLGQMLSQPLQRLALDGWLASAKMDLGPQRPVLTLLADKLSHNSTTHGETHRQNLVTALLVLVRPDDSLPQIH